MCWSRAAPEASVPTPSRSCGAQGARVTTTALPQDRDFVTRLGADRVVDYSTERFEDQVADVDVVFDAVGGETQARSWAVLRPGGTLVSIVQPPDPEAASAAEGRGVFFVVEPDRLRPGVPHRTDRRRPSHPGGGPDRPPVGDPGRVRGARQGTPARQDRAARGGRRLTPAGGRLLDRWTAWVDGTARPGLATSSPRPWRPDRPGPGRRRRSAPCRLTTAPGSKCPATKAVLRRRDSTRIDVAQPGFRTCCR